jgi:non-ribosomal peptide synthetase component F
VSYGQERLWFLDQLMPGSNAYNLAVAMHLSADLNLMALEQSLVEVVRRHEILRTTFAVTDGNPRPVIGSPRSVKLSLVDLSSFGPEEQDNQATRLRHDDALRPFNLATGPLLRVTLIRFETERYLLLTNMHHIVSDGWSMEVLLMRWKPSTRHFLMGWLRLCQNSSSSMPTTRGGQRDWLQGEVLKTQVNYWKKALEGAPTLLQLEADQAPIVPRSGQAAQCRVVFPQELSRLLREFSRNEGSTLFMTLMAGFHALLRRYTPQSDILIGTPIAAAGAPSLNH